MDITLYKTHDAPNVINKTLETVQTVAGTLRGDMDLLTPVVQVEFDTLPVFNYVFVPDFNRYYFVSGLSVVRTKLYELRLTCDTLYTYKDDILKATATGDTGENANAYNTGRGLVTDARKTETVYKFDDMFNSDGVIIMSGVTSVTT